METGSVVGVTTEWGVRETWSDGHAETRKTGSRSEAENFVTAINRVPLSRPRSPGAATGQVMTRTVTYGDWEPVNS